MNYFKKILRFAAPYRKFGYLNIFFNILYALFSALSFAALIPTLDVLFTPEKKVLEEPTYQGIGNLKDYLQDYINYRVTLYSGDDLMKGLVLVIGLHRSGWLLRIERPRLVLWAHYCKTPYSCVQLQAQK